MVQLDEETFGQRWPFVIFVMVSTFLFFAIVRFLPRSPNYEALSLPYILVLFCLVLYAGAWAIVLRMRLKAVGLPHSRWLIALYGLFVYSVCFFLSYHVSSGQFIVPGVFVLLSIPPAFLREKWDGG
jgi:hypothetical protein